MPAGRPTTYSKKLLDKTKEYIEKFESVGDIIPSVEGLSEYLGVGRRTIYDWAKQEDKQEFSHTLDDLQARQKKVLLHKGLTNDFNSAITKLALGNHGMSEKNQTELVGSEGGPIQTASVINFIPVSRKDDK